MVGDTALEILLVPALFWKIFRVFEETLIRLSEIIKIAQVKHKIKRRLYFISTFIF